MKANSVSVLYNLGGGAHGNLGLMLTAVKCINLAVIPYTPPVYPFILNIVVRTANYEATWLRDEHTEIIRLNGEANNVETTLLKQLSRTLLDLYLKMSEINTPQLST